MFCAYDGFVLGLAKDLLSQDLNGGNYYTHYCSECNTYWHLHIHGDGVDLISTRADQRIAKVIKNDLLIKLKERVSGLEKR